MTFFRNPVIHRSQRRTLSTATTFLLCLTAAALADTGLLTPTIGYAHFADGSDRAVYGLPGSFVLGPALDAPAAAFTPANPNHLEQRGATWFIVARDSSVVDALPSETLADDTTPVALLLDGAVLYATPDQLVLHRAGAGLVANAGMNDVRLDCAGVSQLRAISADWVQVTAGSRESVLRLSIGREALFLLPSPNAADLAAPRERRR